jgi:hypothetical protein
MVVVNYLANALPINGIDTGAVSDSYPNLFAPAGITFSIWGVIYLLLAAHTLYQLGLFRSSRDTVRPEALTKIGWYFVITSIANIMWIFAWHYDYIWATFILMLVILTFLIKIANITFKESLTVKENWLVRIPFSVYFGWITVATIANVTVLLVSLGWDGFGISDYMWMIIVVFVGAGIGLRRLFKDQSIAYGLVLIWAYAGIVTKHVTTTGFDWAYPLVVYSTVLCIAAYVVALIVISQRSKKLGDN